MALLYEKTCIGDNPMTSSIFEPFQGTNFDLKKLFVDNNENIIVH